MKILRLVLYPSIILLLFAPAIIKIIEILKIADEISEKTELLKKKNGLMEELQELKINADSCNLDKTFYWNDLLGNHEIKFDIIKEGSDRGGNFWLFFDCKGNLLAKYYSNESRYTGRRI